MLLVMVFMRKSRRNKMGHKSKTYIIFYISNEKVKKIKIAFSVFLSSLLTFLLGTPSMPIFY